MVVCSHAGAMLKGKYPVSTSHAACRHADCVVHAPPSRRPLNPSHLSSNPLVLLPPLTPHTSHLLLSRVHARLQPKKSSCPFDGGGSSRITCTILWRKGAKRCRWRRKCRAERGGGAGESWREREGAHLSEHRGLGRPPLRLPQASLVLSTRTNAPTFAQAIGEWTTNASYDTRGRTVPPTSHTPRVFGALTTFCSWFRRTSSICSTHDGKSDDGVGVVWCGGVWWGVVWWGGWRLSRARTRNSCENMNTSTRRGAAPICQTRAGAEGERRPRRPVHLFRRRLRVTRVVHGHESPAPRKRVPGSMTRVCTGGDDAKHQRTSARKNCPGKLPSAVGRPATRASAARAHASPHAREQIWRRSSTQRSRTDLLVQCVLQQLVFAAAVVHAQTCPVIRNYVAHREVTFECGNLTF